MVSLHKNLVILSLFAIAASKIDDTVSLGDEVHVVARLTLLNYALLGG